MVSLGRIASVFWVPFASVMHGDIELCGHCIMTRFLVDSGCGTDSSITETRRDCLPRLQWRTVYSW
jgi:hypothetical protein